MLKSSEMWKSQVGLSTAARGPLVAATIWDVPWGPEKWKHLKAAPTKEAGQGNREPEA